MPVTGAFTNFLEEKILKHILSIASWTPPSSVYMAIGSGAAGESGSGFTELSGDGYARQKMCFTEPTSADGKTTIKNKYIGFGPAEKDWNAVNSFAIFDAVSAGNLMCWGTLLTNWNVVEDQVFTFDCGSIYIALKQPGPQGGAWSKYLQEKVLKHAFMNTNYTAPSWYAAVIGSLPNYDATGSQLNEPNDVAYSRALITPWGTVTQVGNYATSKNVNGGGFGTATVNWFNGGTVAEAMVDAATGGNLLGYSSFSIAKNVLACDTAETREELASVDIN